MTLPDELCLLIEQLNISPSPSPSPSPNTETPPVQKSMSLTQRLDKLYEMRMSMQSHLQVLRNRLKGGEFQWKEVNGEIEEYCDLLDGIDVLIAGLEKRKEKGVGEEKRHV
jgi:hypothetical protein